MKKITEMLLDILYPRHCPLCHRILKEKNRTICPECETQAAPIEGARCFQCGRPVSEEEEFCEECRTHTHRFESGRGIFLYSSRWRICVVRFKYYGCREYGDFLGDAMAFYARRELKCWKPDCLVPVPLHRRKERRRGFNQAEYLAARISRQSGIPMEASLVAKIRKTKSQKRLSGQERQKNLAGAFAVTKPVEGMCILVVDDVFTTGSTIDAMAECLKKAGALRVHFLTAFIGHGK